VSLALLVLTLLVAACGGEKTNERTIERLLRLLPPSAWDGMGEIKMVDAALLREDRGFRNLSPGDDASTSQAAVDELLSGLVSSNLLHVAPVPSILRWIRSAGPSTGLRLDEFDSVVHAGVPPEFLWAAVGRFDPSEWRASLSACDCDQPQITEYGGTSIYAWGESGEPKVRKSLEPPVYGIVGGGGRWTVNDTVLWRADSDQGIRMMLDTGTDAPDLTANAALLDLVRLFDMSDTYELFISPSLLRISDDRLGLEAETTLGWAAGSFRNEAGGVFAVFFTSPEAAEAGAAHLSETLDERFEAVGHVAASSSRAGAE
jgi:hypothetical protein